MTRVNSSQVRSSVPTQQSNAASQAKQPKQSAPAAQTQAAGWGAGAGKAQALKITAARIDEGPKTTEAVQVPKGFKAEVKTTELNGKDKVHGEEVTYTESTQTLSITNPQGKKLTIGGAAPTEGTGFMKDWKENVAAAKKEPKPEWGLTGMSWDAQNSISGAGTAGKLFSTLDAGSSYMGGAHPNNGAAYRTYDATTGKQVKLDDLFSQKQINDLVNDIASRLPKMKTPDGDIDGNSFTIGGDRKFLRDAINENFTVSTDKAGKVKIDIAWESGIHALGGQMAHFTIDAPNDPAFRAKIGLE